MSIYGCSYHNHFHAVDVFQSCHVMVTGMEGSMFLNELEVLTLLISALCHDLEHPGLNNNYQKNAMTDLALRYNDASPLENHHCAVAWTILRTPGCEMFQFLDKGPIPKQDPNS